LQKPTGLQSAFTHLVQGLEAVHFSLEISGLEFDVKAEAGLIKQRTYSARQPCVIARIVDVGPG
jgi:hypothetical protein